MNIRGRAVPQEGLESGNRFIFAYAKTVAWQVLSEGRDRERSEHPRQSRSAGMA